jgi:hypothetical protein
MRKTIEITADVDIDDILSDIDTEYLMDELKGRKDCPINIDSIKGIKGSIKAILGLREWNTKEDIINKINEIL